MNVLNFLIFTNFKIFNISVFFEKIQNLIGIYFTQLIFFCDFCMFYGLYKTVKGIGLKTAQRIIVDLKDKIASSGMETVNSEMFASAANSEIHDEAVAALTMLGFAQAASQKVVAAILKEEPSAPVEKVIKLALKRL